MPPRYDDKDRVKVRNSYKGQLTTFSSYLSRLDVNSMTSVEANELKMRLGRMVSMYERFDEVQITLECESDDMESQLRERTEFETLYYNLVARAQQLVEDFDKAEGSDRQSSSNDNSPSVKLPTIHLPKFSGSYENWLEFRDTFKSLIHSNHRMDEINKFHYLRTSLEGSAAIVIKSIEFCANNYTLAWDVLCDRYDNKRSLIQNHVAALFNLESISKESSVHLKRLVDQINKNLRSLESLGEPTKHWDTLLIYIFTQKLDSKTFREWEETKKKVDKKEKITLEYFIDFLRDQADLVETLEKPRNQTTQHSKNTNNNTNKVKTLFSSQSASIHSKKCPNCNGEHNLNECSQFLSMSNDSRLKLLPTLKVCFNCLNTGHFANVCKKKGCKICKYKHNTLVHVSDFKSKIGENNVNENSQNNSNSAQVSSPCENKIVTPDSVVLSANVLPSNCSSVLLSTALIKVYDSENKEHIARAILDSGSTSCLMTEKLFNQLNLSVSQVDKSVVGINNISSHISKMCQVPIKSLNEMYTTNLQCFILPTITDNVPSSQVDISDINIPSEICLADPYFHTPAAVDIIIGADVFWDILGTQKIMLGKNKPTIYETKFGWLVSGPIILNNSSKKLGCNFSKITSQGESINDSDININHILTRFWQLEEVNCATSSYSEEEHLCEEHFVKNTTRTKDGRFCVKIPLKESPQVLGESLNRAIKCFTSLERRFKTQPNLGALYKEFMTEYESLGHMSKCASVKKDGHFIPHHGVLRDDSSTTKLRAVFNASNVTTTGLSFNDIQMVGPTVQDDLMSILLRFRQHKIVIAADVEKMYRQVLVHPDFRHLQQIVWRSDPADDINAYQLNTVTYGTASAPFLATRCLKQVGLDCDDKKIKEIIIHDFYVDDLLTGGNTLDEIQYIKDQVTTELASACMPLRKWKSNEPRLVGHNEVTKHLNIGSHEPNKTLGLNWLTETDSLCFPIDVNIKENNTKRSVLSVIAQIFDPIGILSPVVIKMKILLQKLWLHKLTWDEPLPIEICNEWIGLLKDLPNLNEVRIPRVVLCDSCKWVEIHVFADASEKAYGACLYIRSINDEGQVMVRLLTAKSRVAPIKPTTIPRLELCAALVAANIYKKVVDALRLKVNSAVFWTDSTIVLGWLNMIPSRLQPFVRNRVATILEITGSNCWRHVPTELNPADIISRGTNVTSLEPLNSWWSGPQFLQNEPSAWPNQSKHPEENLPETRPEKVLHTVVAGEDTCNGLIDFNRFSSLLKLKRTVAYVLRFINIKCKKQKPSTSHLVEHELQDALNVITRLSQKESFPEYTLLSHNKSLPKKSPLLKFNPFIDNNNIMRVGGRLSNSKLPYDTKHPILLQSTHRFCLLLFESKHIQLMHAGPQLLLNSVRENYWPVGGLRLAKACYRKCVRCIRMKGNTFKPKMGDLPKDRVTPSYPFENVGVDYAGPVTAASRQGRGCRFIKVYIVLFVCFCTKAIHLELVGDLTSNNYLLALRRFMSRRGKPRHIYSDNGTTFVGACNEISKFLKENNNSLAQDMANEGIEFNFIPAYSPHFGGLWEAGVKSTKFHLLRVLGNCNLTYEEINSTLIQIEAILNSRPLTPLSTDPEDLTPLTPGHFLIGRPLTSIPSRDYTGCPANHLMRYQRIEQLRQHFWMRWSKEYITQLQQRVKWQTNSDSMKVNSVVILKDDNLPPLKWKMGRIIALHPGNDGICRVADVKTSGGIVRRSFSKLCPLLDEEDVHVESHASNARGHV